MDRDRFLSQAGATLHESPIRRMGALGARVPDLISFGAGNPAADLFAWDEFRAIAAEVLDGADPSVLQYGPTRGYPPLLEGLADLLTGRGIRAATDELVVTTGSQQALALAARLFVDPGDVVLMELPTYAGAITAFRNAQARLAGVAQTSAGIDLDDLDRVAGRERAAGRRIAFLYVVPNFQNPTGLLVSRSTRQQLLEWAARRDVLVVEDDPYGALRFDGVAPDQTRPLKADDRDGRVVYMSSFSKIVAPGLRVAWVAAPAALARRFEVAKQSLDACSGALDQRLVYEIWRRGVLAARLPALRRAYQEKRDVMERALVRHLPGLVSWQQPKGGLFLWVSFGEGYDTEALLNAAVGRGVGYVAGSAFFVDGRRSPFARLAFAAPAAARIEEGASRLAAAFADFSAGVAVGNTRPQPGG